MITPKPFQQTYIENVLHLFRAAKGLYDATSTVGDRRRIFGHNAAVLLKAPTGSGKTIMAGSVVETFSREEKVVWFWFAPFKGLVGQSAMSLRDHHAGLRVRELGTDRKAAGTRSGDTFVLTWASVVAASAEARKARSEREDLASLDIFLEELREAGFRIGVVIDEAHHGIGAKTQSVKFFREVLDPDYCLMITATPDDADADKFGQASGITQLNRVTVSRPEVVEAGLIKPEVKAIAYLSPPDQKVMADFEAAALADAVRTHRAIKAELEAQGIKLVPLLMVQVGKGKDAVEETKRDLLQLGFSEEAITVHTAKEPDENFLAMSSDHEKEVLIFKMAAALGFDAPRAFCLVSMRAVRDTDFGTQLIGRIMRVHGLLQGRKVPPLLENGYLFLADHESQGGVSEAAMKINKLRSELGQVSPFNMLVNVGGRSGTQLVTNGQPQMFPTEEVDEDGDGKEEKLPGMAVPTTGGGEQDYLDILVGLSGQGTEKGGDEIDKPREEYVYALKPGMPHRFMTQELPLEVDDLLACVEQQIKFDDAALLKSLAAQTEVIRVEKDLFGKLAEMRTTMLTRLDLEKAAERAQELLFKQSYLDPKGLLDHLLKRLAAELRNHGQHEVAEDDERLEAALDLILINDPKLLREVQKSCAARFAVTREADLLPGRVESAFPLESSHKNIYGIFPADLNSWEKAFAKLLDADGSGTVLWWHRNPVRKRHSVCIMRPDGGRFFPDFIVGVKGRTISKDGILLIETKYAIGTLDSQIKALVEHKDYGKALMIHWRDWTDEKRREAMVVEYDEAMDKNVLDRVFRCSALPTY